MERARECKLGAAMAAKRRHAVHTSTRVSNRIETILCLLQVGAVNATFGIKGVQEHCFFLKTMEDAKTLRRHIRCACLLCSRDYNSSHAGWS